MEGKMEEDKILHGILLKKAKEAQYTNFEIEQINLQSESLFIRYYLEREAAKIVENTNIEEDVLKKIYEENQSLYKFPKKVKIDTIFVRDLEKAEEILKDINTENFNKFKEKNDEKAEEAKDVSDEFLFITEIHPAIAEEILNENKKNVIIKKAIPVQEGFHIIYLKDIEDERQAIFDEVRENILVGVKRNIFGQVYNQLIEDIANERVTLQEEVKAGKSSNEDNKKSE
ncbi:peptidylprolyl isomerase [Fusobacterium polymorphum]|uniref:peptidylprolyl isomerase n=2 Tax=Fusobacterium nucleatum subsp. polymorphum TaxID=76857 RepID=A0A2B7YJX8_FUSNP|nr:peptidylprolyl isomerase [Fusobacterium polymorphum]